MLDGRVEVKTYIKAEVYDLANTDGARGRAEASVIPIELYHDQAGEGVIVKVGTKRFLVPPQVIEAARKIRK